MDSRPNFTGKARLYHRHRPTYPPEAIAFFLEHWRGRFPPEAGPAPLLPQTADIGAGTGLFTRLLLERGLPVTAVEPDPQLLAQAKASLAEFPRCRFLQATAEHTGLEAASQDLLTCAQSFHWLDRPAFAREALRVLRPGGQVALLWNRRREEHPLVRENGAICREFCPNFRGFSAGVFASPQGLQSFFVPGSWRELSIHHPIPFTREGFVGRNLSSSFAPLAGEAGAAEFAAALGRLFDRHSQSGVLWYPNRVYCLVGRPCPGGGVGEGKK